MIISSPAFKNNKKIPSKYTCDGENVSPPLKISDVPDKTKSLVLILDDPDAPMGTWVHWVIWNINPVLTEIKENSTFKEAKQGRTSFGSFSYKGPCPPSGTHRYFFKLYALDKILDLSKDTGKAILEQAMQGHVLAQTELVGLYSRESVD